MRIREFRLLRKILHLTLVSAMVLLIPMRAAIALEEEHQLITETAEPIHLETEATEENGNDSEILTDAPKATPSPTVDSSVNGAGIEESSKSEVKETPSPNETSDLETTAEDTPASTITPEPAKEEPSTSSDVENTIEPTEISSTTPTMEQPSLIPDPTPTISPEPIIEVIEDEYVAAPKLLGVTPFAISSNLSDVESNGSFVLSLKLSSEITDCGGFTIDISYNGTAFSPGTARSTLSSSNTVVINESLNNAIVRMVYVSGTVNSPVTLKKNQVVLTIPFTVKNGATYGSYNFTVEMKEIFDSRIEELPSVTGFGTGTSIEVKPSSPVLRGATVNSSSSITVNWDTVANVSGYYVWYMREGTGSYVLVSDSLGQSENTVTATGLNPGTKYTFVIRSYVTSSTGEKIWDAFNSTGVSATTQDLSAPVLSEPEIVGTNSIKISWSAVDGASGYAAWYRTAGGNWTMIGYASDSRRDITATGLKQNVNYFFTVRAFYDNNGTYLWGEVPSVDKSGRIPLPSSPVLRGATVNSSSSITVNWDTVANVSGYYMWYMRQGSSSYVLVSSSLGQSENTVTVTGLNPATKYTFVMRSYVTSGTGEKIWDAFNSTGISATTRALSAPVLSEPEIVSTNSIKISWSAVDRASGYAAWYRTAGGNWTMIGYASDSRCDITATGLKQNVNYFFTVRAYYNNNGTYLWGDMPSVEKNVRIPLPSSPVLRGATVNSSSSITVNWDTVANVSGYYVWYMCEGSGSYVLVSSSLGQSENTVMVTGLNPGTKYTFVIRSYVTSGTGEKIWDAFNSTGISATTRTV